MEDIKYLHRDGFDEVMRCGKDLIIFFYKEGDALSILGMQTMREVSSLICRSFDMYFVDALGEPDILYAFSVKNAPEYVAMKNSKIYKRSNDLLKPSEVLALLK